MKFNKVFPSFVAVLLAFSITPINAYQSGDDLYLYTFENSNMCQAFGSKLNSEKLNFYENMYKFKPIYYDLGQESKCDDATIQEGRYVVKYVVEGEGRNARVYRIRGNITNGNLVQGDKVEVSKEDVLNYTIHSAMTSEAIALNYVNEKNAELQRTDAFEVNGRITAYKLEAGNKVYLEVGRQSNSNYVQESKTEIAMAQMEEYFMYEGGHYDDRIEAFIWAKEITQKLIRDSYENKRVGGLGDNILLPSQPITRGQMASLIVIVMDIDRNNVTGNNFSDISIDNVNYTDILVLKNMDILQGKTDGQFHTDDSVTREEMVSMIVRTLEKKNFNFTEFDNILSQREKRYFPDLQEGPHKTNIVRLSNMKFEDTDSKVVNGYSDGSFKGANPINRHEAAIIAKQGTEAYLRWLSVTNPADYSRYF